LQKSQTVKITDRIARSVAKRADVVFLRTDFERFGSASQIARALNILLSKGSLVRVGVGVYAKAKPSVLSGKPIPAKPLEVLAPQVLEKLGVAFGPSRLARDYNEGRSTQVPAGVVFNVGKSRITRKLAFNGTSVQYERA
jgi:Family of unknown function (DUF6088)